MQSCNCGDVKGAGATYSAQYPSCQRHPSPSGSWAAHLLPSLSQLHPAAPFEQRGSTPQTSELTHTFTVITATTETAKSVVLEPKYAKHSKHTN